MTSCSPQSRRIIVFSVLTSLSPVGIPSEGDGARGVGGVVNFPIKTEGEPLADTSFWYGIVGNSSFFNQERRCGM